MRVRIRMSNPDSPEQFISLEAAVDPSNPVALVPRWLAHRLELTSLEGALSTGPAGHSYARFHRGDETAVVSVLVSDETREVVLGLSTFTALLLEIDRATDELRDFDPLLL